MAFGQLDAEMSEAVELSKALRTSEYARGETRALVVNDDAPLSRRIRAALIGADNDPLARELLTNYVLEGPVDDVVVIATHAKVPIADDGTIVKTWQSQDAPRGTLIRAACMLANDPQHVEQLRNAKDTARLVKLLAAENPVWSNHWSEGFAPIADDLVLPLSAVLLDEARSYSSLNVVNLLTQYAADDPTLLASLLPTADAAELSVLTDAIAASETGIRVVRQVDERPSVASQTVVDVSRPWGSPWWCVGSRLPVEIAEDEPLAADTEEQLTAYESVIGPHAIVSHKCPRDAFESIAAAVASAGYRVSEIGPYKIGDETFVAVVWLRDGVASRFILDATPEEVQAANATNRSDGYLPDSVTACRGTGDGAVVYGCTWIDPPDDVALVDSDLYIDVHQDNHERDGWGALQPRGLGLPRSNMSVRKADGDDYFTSIRWQTESSIGYHDGWSMTRDKYRSQVRYSRASTLLSGRASLITDDTETLAISPVWWDDLPIDSQEIEYQARREHLRLARQLFAAGFYPMSINVAPVGNDPTPQFCSTWWRGRASVDDVVRQSNQRRNLAIALFRLGDSSQVEAALEADNDEELRGAMLAGFHQFDLPPDWLMEHLEQSENQKLRRSCALALALYPTSSVADPFRNRVASALPRLYAESSDPGLRSALEAITSSWRLAVVFPTDAAIQGELRTITGDRLVILKPENPVWVGSPAEEPGRDGHKEPQTPVVIDRSFAIATREVTIEQYLKFQPEHRYAKDYARTVDCSAIDVSWFDAAKYCRFASPAPSRIRVALTIRDGW